MPVLLRHPLVTTDLRDAYDWYEDQQAWGWSLPKIFFPTIAILCATHNFMPSVLPTCDA